MSGVVITSVAKKFWMSVMGIFLVLFLPVHMGINSLLVFDTSRESFNVAANFMGTNPVIKVMEIFLIAGFLIHIIMGLVLQLQNWWARPVRYKVTTKSETSTFSRQMIWTAGLILIFLVIHLGDFYFKAKFSHAVPEFHASNGEVYHDLGLLVIEKFKITGFMIFYGVMFIFLGFHLWHGFQSSFQSLGLNHPTYTPVIKGIGKIYTIVITAGFMAILLIIYFSDKY